MRRAPVAAWTALACALAGCLSGSVLQGTPSQRYEPPVLEAPRGNVLALQLTAVVVSFGDRNPVVEVTAKASAPAMIARAALSSASAAACAAGIEAQTIELDGQRRWDRPIGVEGTHKLAATFIGATALMRDADTVLDVELASAGEPSCVRVALEPHGRDSAPRGTPRWTVGGVLRGGFPTGVGRYAMIDDELRFLYWFPRLAVGAELGWTLSNCSKTCGNYQVPLWLLAETIALERRGFGLGVSAAYGLSYGPDGGAGPDVWLHGPRLALHLLHLVPPVGAAGGGPTRGKGIEVSLAYQRALVGPVPPMFVVGFGVVAF